MSQVSVLYTGQVTGKKEERLKKKEHKRSGWFRKLGGNTNDFSIFCPAPPSGHLAAKWKMVMEEVRVSRGSLVKGYVAEKSGIPLSALLFSSQPGEKDNCGKSDCNTCVKGTTKRLSCRKVARGGMVYSCQCITCKLEQKESWYHGWSARTLYTRQGEHNGGLVAGRVDNALFKHAPL